MTNSEMTFSGDASNVLAEMKKLVDQNKALEKSILAASKAATEGSKLATQAYGENNASIKRLISDNDKLKEKLEEVKKKQQEAGKNGIDVWAGIGTAIVSKGLSALQRMIDLQIQYNKTLAESGRLQDEAGRRLQVQALIQDKEFQARTLPRIGKAANKAAVSLRDAQEVAAELVSQGVDEEAATGEVLEEVLMGAQATATADKKQLATSLMTMLKSRGRKLTAENVRDEMQRTAALFAPTSLQAADLQELAKVGGVLQQGGVDEATALAGFTTLKDVGGFAPEQAATGLRNMVMRMGGDLSEDTKKMWEDTFGKGVLDQINPVKHGLAQATANLNALLDRVDKESQLPLAQNLFGRENAAQAITLARNMPAFLQNIERQQDKTVLAEGAKIGTGGINAAAIRQANQEQLDLIQQQNEAAEKQRIIQAAVLELRKAGHNEATVALNEKILQAQATFQTLEGFKKFLPHQLGEFDEETQKRILQGFGRAEGAAEGSDLTERNVAGPALPNVKIAPAFRGQKLNVFNPEKEMQALELEREQAELELARTKLAAEQPESEGGVKISQAEKKQIDLQERTLAAIQIMIKELQIQRKRTNVDAGI